MESFDRDVVRRLPLAEAVQRVLAHGLEPSFLEAFYQEHRGRGYADLISFAVLTQLVSEALLGERSGLATFTEAKADGTLPASVEAIYGKLRRIPPDVSMALLEQASLRLESLLPPGAEECPLAPSLRQFTGIVLDGKVSKGVPHRLKPLRGAKGGLIGGRSLVAYHLSRGHVLAFQGAEDGDANDVRFVPELTARLRLRLAGKRLWVADRQFASAKTLAERAWEGDAFVVRYSKASGFTADPQCPPQQGVDDAGRPYTEEWGWLGKGPRRKQVPAGTAGPAKDEHPGLRVRRLHVARGAQEPLILLTNLLDARDYPAVDVLETYRNRVDIEYVFQRITEIFHLRRLIGSSPRATLFQLSLCLLLYNVLQLVRGYLATANHKQVAEVSPKKLLEDVRKELTALYRLLGTAGVVRLLGVPLPTEELVARLRALLQGWQGRWTKAKRRRNRPPKPRRKSGHACAHRILTAAAGTKEQGCS